MMSAFAMVPAIREFFGGTIVLGGGIINGSGIRAAETLGADLASMGTAFIACPESMASDAYRQMLLDSDIDDLILTRAVSGVPAYWLRKVWPQSASMRTNSNPQSRCATETLSVGRRFGQPAMVWDRSMRLSQPPL